jgi:hypothetical protein
MKLLRSTVGRTGAPLAAAALLACLLSCDGSEPVAPDPEDTVATIIVAPPEVTVDIDATTNLAATPRDEAGLHVPVFVTWSSSDPSLATVSAQGVVSGLREGTVEITARVRSVTGTATVHVRDPYPPGAPGNVTATVVTDTEVDVAWEDNSTNEKVFVIEREAVPAGAPGTVPAAVFQEAGTVGMDVTTYRDSELTPGTSYRYRVLACNDNGCTEPEDGSQGETVTYPTLAIGTASLPRGSAGKDYLHVLESTGASEDVVWSLSEGALPEGLDLAADGTLSGRPLEAGTFPFEVRAEGLGQAVTRSLLVTVDPFRITTTELPMGRDGTPYEEALGVTEADGAWAWSVVVGELPGGLSLDGETGVVSGVPAAPGTFPFTVRVTNSGLVAAADLEITVGLPLLVVTTESLPHGLVDTNYVGFLEAAGGDGVHTWEIVTGNLPSRLSLNRTTGRISGRPNAVELATFMARVRSGDGQEASRDLTLVVETGPLSILGNSLPTAFVDQPYSEGLKATGGDGVNYEWDLLSGTPPPGLSFSGASGRVLGTPTTVGQSQLAVSVTSLGQTVTGAVTIEVLEGPLVLERQFLDGGHVGVPYFDAVVATGGDGNITYTVTDGALPAGLGLDASSGVVTGSPTTPGMSYFEVTAESAGSQQSVILNISVSTRGPGGFNLVAFNVADEIPSELVREELDYALAKWEAAITGELDDRTFGSTQFPPPGFSPDPCENAAPFMNGETVDDIVVVVDIASIDGAGRVLGRAGVCVARSSPRVTTLFGILQLDAADLDSRSPLQMRGLITHEIGHVVGIGTLWETNGYLQGKVSSVGGDPRYTGPAGVAEYQSALGGADADIPVANTIGPGTYNSHWREVIFKDELMTGIAAGALIPQPMSSMTIASVGDLGYVVDPGAADPYSCPRAGCAPPPSAPGAALLHPGVPVDEVLRGPILILEPDGTLRVVGPPAR